MARYVYINSDLSVHYPDHFGLVYSELGFTVIGWSSMSENKSIHQLKHVDYIMRINKKSPLFRIRRFLNVFITLVQKLKQNDEVIVHDDPIIFLAIKFYSLSTRTNLVLTFRICHLFGENLLENGNISPFKKFLVKVWITLRGIAIYRSSATIVMSEAMSKYFYKNFKINKRLNVIPSAVKIPPNKLYKRENKPEKKLINLIYIGNIDLGREFGTFLEALSELKNQGHQIKLDIFHSSFRKEETDRLKSLLKSLNLQDIVQLLRPKRHKKIVAEFKKYDAGISIYAQNGCFSFNSPVKTLEYIAYRLPWIGTNIAEHRRLLSIETTGLVFVDKSSAVEQIIKVKEHQFTYNKIDNFINLSYAKLCIERAMENAKNSTL